jgi:hypothetical protein
MTICGLGHEGLAVERRESSPTFLVNVCDN